MAQSTTLVCSLFPLSPDLPIPPSQRIHVRDSGKRCICAKTVSLIKAIKGSRGNLFAPTTPSSV